ncbi:MAG: VIT and VWA domain-containing protein [Acidobacteriota bacterium]
MRKIVFLLVISVCLAAAVYGQQTTEGTLYAVGKQGAEMVSCPLKSTAVKADISGFVSRVSVRQEFENSFAEPIEAVYVFPLSQNGAVDAMTMTVGDRVIRGKIMRREDAKKTYETAKSEGKTASLLDQERTNIFTQSVANVMPGERVIVEITYVETLKYEDGAYEFVFPMTVAPRYIPGGVNDVARISPPFEPIRNGSDITVEVNLNAGVPVEEIRSISHDISQINFSANAAKITLRDEKVIPNKDFILRYDVTGKRIEDAVLTHRDERGGFFTLILQPPDKVATEDRTPKEIVFVLDTSGSMSGFPIEKAQEAMKLSLDGLYPEDTFNLITFAGDTAILFDKPVPATRANLDAARKFLAEREGYGGTEMMKAIKAALEPSDAQDHLRIVCFMTDGEVGNDDEIVAEVQRHPNARVFSFGIGQSVNRALLDKIAIEGKGEAEYVALEDDGSRAAKKFYERVRTPLLTDLSVDWNGMPVADVYPGRLTDLFSAKPVILHGRYTRGANGIIRLRGKLAGQPYVREIKVDLPENNSGNPGLSTLWARTRIDELSTARLKAPTEKAGADLDALITNIGLEFGLMTQFTSFVAVEDRIVNPNGSPASVAVPSVLPQGMDPANADTSVAKSQINSGAQTATITGGGGGGASALPINGRRISNLAVVTARRGSKSSAKGKGHGNGNGSGSGSGSGNGSGSAGLATVNVTSNEVVTVDSSSTQVSSAVTNVQVQALPRGTGFTSLLKLNSKVRPRPMGGQFSVDGSSGSENSFVIDGQDVTGVRPGLINPTSRNPLEGQMINVGKPEFSPPPKTEVHATVAVRIDRDGKVISAMTSDASGLLKEACEKAAGESTFNQVTANGRPVRVAGEIVYAFGKDGKLYIFLQKMHVEPPTPEERRLNAISEKLHFWLFDLVERIQKGDPEPSANEAKFVHEGKADVQITLKANTPAIRAKLTAGGFEAVSTKGLKMSGSIAVAQVAGLATIDGVVLVTPRM